MNTAQSRLTDYFEWKISQAISYIPYGEVFVEQQSGGWSSPYLFNAKELDSETGLYYYGARYLDPSDAMWLSVDPLWEKYVGMTPYQYCAGNPVKLVDVDGRSFDEANEEKAKSIEKDIDIKLTELNNTKNKTDDEIARIKELQQSKQDIENMRSKEGIYFQFKTSSDISNPAGQGNPTIEGVGTNIVTMYVDDNMESYLHEARHGGDVARGKLKVENYGVSHEVSAYRAQYAWNGNLEYRDIPSESIMIQRVLKGQNPCMNKIESIDNIDSSVVNSMVQDNFQYVYPPNGMSYEEWNSK